MHNKLSVNEIKRIFNRDPWTDFLGTIKTPRTISDPNLSVFHMDLQLFLESFSCQV